MMETPVRPRPRLRIALLATAVACGLVATPVARGQGQTDEETVARRRLESGRSFLSQRNYSEALKDLHAVAETHSTTSVADDALLELARYYLDIGRDPAQAASSIDTLLRKYPTSNSAPEAYVISGRLALARSRQGADVKKALADFERVFRLFPNSDAVPHALYLMGDTSWYDHDLDAALSNLSRVEVEYPTTTAAAGAYISASRVLLAQGDPISAMEDLQHVRTRWPGSPEAAIALQRLTLLYRLYVRGRTAPPYALTDEVAGPAKLDNVTDMALADGSIYWATNAAVDLATPGPGQTLPGPVRPRGLAVGKTGIVYVLEAGTMRSADALIGPLAVPRQGELPVGLERIEAAVQLSTSEWFVMDSDFKGIARFSSDGAYAGAIVNTRVTRLAVNDSDEVAGLDRDKKSVVLLDPTGQEIGRIPYKGSGYELQNPEDLAFDAYGHLYVLDRTSIAVFSPYPATPVQGPGLPASGDRGSAYQLRAYLPSDRNGPLRRATAFAVAPDGAIYVHDDRAQKILVLR